MKSNNKPNPNGSLPLKDAVLCGVHGLNFVSDCEKCKEAKQIYTQFEQALPGCKFPAEYRIIDGAICLLKR